MKEKNYLKKVLKLKKVNNVLKFKDSELKSNIKFLISFKNNINNIYKNVNNNLNNLINKNYNFNVESDGVKNYLNDLYNEIEVINNCYNFKVKNIKDLDNNRDVLISKLKMLLNECFDFESGIFTKLNKLNLRLYTFYYYMESKYLNNNNIKTEGNILNPESVLPESVLKLKNIKKCLKIFLNSLKKSSYIYG